MGRLDAAEIGKAMAALAGWTLEGATIKRQYSLVSFSEAIAFVVRLAFEAEAADHHPDIQISFKRVTLTYTTHSEGGLTRKDFDGARKADALARV